MYQVIAKQQDICLGESFLKEDLNCLNENRNMKLLLNINLICCIYICMWTIIPIFRNLTNRGLFQVLFLAIASLWFLTSVSIGRKWLYDIMFMSMFGSIYIMFMVLYYVFGYGDMKLSRLVSPAFLFLYAFMGYFYSTQARKKTIHTILFFVAISFIVTSFTTSFTLLENIDASRLMTSSSTSPEITEYLESRNVAAYDFVYGVVVLIPILIMCFRYLKKSSKKSFLMISIVTVLAFTVIVLSNFTTAYFLLLLAITLALLTNNKRPFVSMLILGIFLLMVSPFLLDLLNLFLITMKNMIPSMRTQIKLEGIISIINGNIDYGSVTSRSGLLRNSIESFLSAPIFGVGAYYSNREVIGIHAQFIDDLGRFGIVGAIPIFTFMFLILKKVFMRIQDRKIKNAYLYSAFIFFLLGFMNPTQAYGISFSVFFMLPVIVSYINSENESILITKMNLH